MLVDTKLTIAYKCASCGTFEFFSVFLFGLPNGKNSKLTCHCAHSHISFAEGNARIYKVNIPCIACGGEHIHHLSRRELLEKHLCLLCCPNTGIVHCIMGRDEDVRKKVDSLERELDDIINMFGYDNYFSNTQVMFDSLNKIHDIAEQGNLMCECGCFEIDMVLLPDRILLKCKDCAGIRLLKASSNEDLKKILTINGIMLSAEYIHTLDDETLSLIGEPVIKK